MKLRSLAALLLLGSSWIFSIAQRKQAPKTSAPGAADSSYVPVLKFDPKRDGAADIQAAIAEAQRTGKRILLDVGGDWCTWCRVFDEFFNQHPDIAHLRDDNFITVAIFYSHENKNQRVLSAYPGLEGIPHFFVLEKNGTFLYSQGIVRLETGGEPDPEKVKRFLLNWSIQRAKDSAESR